MCSEWICGESLQLRTMKLSELSRLQKARIIRVGGSGAFRKRILEMGFVQGQLVEMISKAPLGDPTRYRIMGYDVALRAAEAQLVDIELVDDNKAEPVTNLSSSQREVEQAQDWHKEKSAKSEAGHVLTIALVGNPNCGKTSLFNFASGAHEKTGNYSGVTVDAREGHLDYAGFQIRIVDLPGTYSLTAYSPEERYVREYILSSKPDVIVNVVDSTNLERNLYLTLQLREMGARCVVALNMWDELTGRGDYLNRLKLAELLGVACVPTNGRTGKGIGQMLEAAVAAYRLKEDKGATPFQKYDDLLVQVCEPVRDAATQVFGRRLSDYELLKLIEGDPELMSLARKQPEGDALEKVLQQATATLKARTGKDSETYCTDVRYAFLAKLTKQTYLPAPAQEKQTLKQRIDAVLTHRIWGLPIFLFLLWFMFWATFTIGQYPMDWIEAGVAALGEGVKTLMPEGSLRDLITDGIINGVGSVIVFLPQILILFLFISILEDTGYMARAVFLIDRTMRSFGLHGRSFIPLVMGFGCNVPAIMATRTIEDRKVRLTTMLVNPFMSCSARLQVYILFVNLVFPMYAGTALFAIYMFGVLVALLMAFVFRRSLLKGNESPFVIELPPYRIPTLRSSLHHMWDKGVQYLQKMGSVILVAALLIWFLGYFPRSSSQDHVYEQRIQEAEQQYAVAEEEDTPDRLEKVAALRDSAVSHIEWEWESVRQRESFLGRLGTAIEPAIRPLGFDWRIGVGLLSGIAAKEVVVSTLGVLLQLGPDNDENSPALREKLPTVTWDAGPKQGEPLFTPLASLALLVFVVLYVPCIAVISAIRRESGSWKWALFAAFYSTAIAYVASLLVYQIGSLL